MIVTYEHRKFLKNLIDEREYKRVVELGVACGDFSCGVLSKSKLTELVLVDKWNDHHNETEYQLVLKRATKDSRIKVIRSLFSEAVSSFSDGYFDFIYIDGYAHTGQNNGETLDMWWPKVRVGGFFGGHDYHPNYKPTIQAVDNFCEKHNLELHLTGEEKFPSWYVFKK